MELHATSYFMGIIWVACAQYVTRTDGVVLVTWIQSYLPKKHTNKRYTVTKISGFLLKSSTESHMANATLMSDLSQGGTCQMTHVFDFHVSTYQCTIVSSMPHIVRDFSDSQFPYSIKRGVCYNQSFYSSMFNIYIISQYEFIVL